MADPVDPPLIAAKLRAPGPPREAVARELTLRLSPPELPAVTIVEAPAGFGKTTTVAQWAAAQRDNVAWVSLDPADNDPVRFWSYVVTSLAPLLGRDGDRALNALRDNADIRDGVLPWVASGIGEKPIHLVLDDYHLVTDSEINGQVAYLTEQMPARLHLVVVTRADPPLPRARLRVDGARLREIGPDELRFTDDEAKTLINGRHGIGLDDGDVETLVERTEGWPAGLALAALSLVTSDDRHAFVGDLPGSASHIREFLLSEVLARQSPEERDLLVRCSILDRYSGPLCDAVLDRTGSAAILRDLRRANAFVQAVDPQERWYRLHQLFRDALRQELKEERAAELPELHGRASRWYREEGMFAEAIDHALAAGEHDLAADLISVIFLAEFAEGRASTVERWLEALPEETVKADSRLALAGACLVSVVGHQDEVETWLQIAERGQARDPLPAALPSMEAGIAIVRGSQSDGNVGRQLEAARVGARLCGDRSSPWYAYAVGALGFALYWAGEPAEARSVIREAQAAMGSPLPAGVLLAYDAFIALDGGDWRLGDRLAQQAAAKIEEHGFEQSPRACVIRVAQGRAKAARRQVAGAMADLDEAVELARDGPYRVELIDALLALASLQIAEGVAQRGEDHLREARRLMERCADPGILSSRLENVGKASAAARPDEVPERLSRRELEVLQLLPSALSESEIGARLFISHNTVHSHTKAIFRKLDVSSRAQAVERARAIGLLEPDDLSGNAAAAAS